MSASKRRAAIRATLLSTTLSAAQIGALYGVHRRTVERMLADLRRHGHTRPERPQPVPKCGTRNAYNFGCRCEDCTAACTVAHRAWVVANTARLAADPTLAEHGTRATYSNWGCRCESCRAANARASAARRARREASTT